MEEVRSYWQVASISHFCTVFGKPFRLPSFEPEELEQAFIIDIPAPTPATTTIKATIPNKDTKASTIDPVSPLNGIDTNSIATSVDKSNGQDREESPESPAPEEEDQSEDYVPPASQIQSINTLQQQAQQQPPPQQNDEPQNLHLLVKLAIALLRPHFSTKIR